MTAPTPTPTPARAEGQRRTARRATRGRAGTALLAGAVAAALVPALAAPAQAAAVTLTPEQAVNELVAASSATHGRLLAQGGTFAGTVSASIGGSSLGLMGTTRLTLDAARRNARVVDVSPELPGEVYDELVDGSDQCDYDRFGGIFGGRSKQVYREGHGEYTHLAKAPSQVKKARRLVGRNKARWQLRPRKSVQLARVVRANDPMATSLIVLQDPEIARITSATRTSTANGVRYVLRYVDTGNEYLDSGVTTVDVSGGVVTSTRDDILMGELTMVTRSTYAYGARTVRTPARAATVARRALVQGCRAVQTREAVAEVTAKVAGRLNDRVWSKGGKVTTKAIRRATRKALRKVDDRLRVRSTNVAGGVRVVGRHALLKPAAQRRVVVDDGIARVRRG